MRQYAAKTQVPVDRSKAEIEHILTQYGASEFVYGSRETMAMIGFTAKGRNIRMTLPLPLAKEFLKDARGWDRAEGTVVSLKDQATRQKWRALTLIVKAKLESVQSGVATFEDEFMPYIVLPGGKTVSQEITPKIAEVYATKQPGALLLGMPSRGKE